MPDEVKVQNEDQAVSREKARYWVAVCYPENMVEGWQDDIGELLQVPFAYCIHDKCFEKDGTTPRKVHVHIMVAFSNTTTYNHALKVFKRLGNKAVNTCQSVVGIRHMYDYLIHDTEDSRKKHKHLYEKSERITGNNFDIGSYEQISTLDKNRMVKELADKIIEDDITNFRIFYILVSNNYDTQYFEVMKNHAQFFRALIAGNYQARQE